MSGFAPPAALGEETFFAALFASPMGPEAGLSGKVVTAAGLSGAGLSESGVPVAGFIGGGLTATAGVLIKSDLNFAGRPHF